MMLLRSCDGDVYTILLSFCQTTLHAGNALKGNVSREAYNLRRGIFELIHLTAP